MQSGNSDAAGMLRAMRSFLKENDMMAYLAMMSVRVDRIASRTKARTGWLYVHCDPTASHYLKILLDAVFGQVIQQRNYLEASEYSLKATSANVHELL